MVIEIAVAVLAGGFVVLVAFLVPALIQLKRSASEAQRLLAHLDAEVPAVLKDVRAVTGNLGEISNQARESVQHAATLLHAVGEVGESVQQAHRVMRGKSLAVVVKLASMFAGVRAASAVVKDRVHKEQENSVGTEGGNSDGKR